MPQEKSRTGYRNPPKHTQFKPGISGNPAGRPKKTYPGIGQVVMELLSKQTKTSSGKKLSRAEAIVIRHLANGINGNVPSIRWLLEMYKEEYEKTEKNDVRYIVQGGLPTVPW